MKIALINFQLDRVVKRKAIEVCELKHTTVLQSTVVSSLEGRGARYVHRVMAAFVFIFEKNLTNTTLNNLIWS